MAKKLIRNFVNTKLIINSFNDVKPYFDDLNNRPLNNYKEIWQWLIDRSELESVLSEDLAWRYIKMNCNTSDDKLAKHFNTFITEIEPKISLISNKLDKKLFADEVLSKVDKAKLFTIIRKLKKDIELFREENVPIEYSPIQLTEGGLLYHELGVE